MNIVDFSFRIFTGGLSLGLVGSWMNAYGKDGALLGAFCIHLTACYLTFLDTPVTASLNMTGEPAFVGPKYQCDLSLTHPFLGAQFRFCCSAYIALTTSFLFGFGKSIKFPCLQNLNSTYWFFEFYHQSHHSEV